MTDILGTHNRKKLSALLPAYPGYPPPGLTRFPGGAGDGDSQISIFVTNFRDR